jgi:hypothetical protein
MEKVTMTESNDNERPDLDPKSVTWREFKKLEKAANAGDLDAQKRLALIHESESYKEWQRIMQEGAQALADRLHISEDVLREFSVDSNPHIQTWLDSIAANSNLSIHEWQKNIFPNKASPLHEVFSLDPSTKSAVQEAIDALVANQKSLIPTMGVSNRFLVSHLPSSQERLASEIARNTRSNQELRNELRQQTLETDKSPLHLQGARRLVQAVNAAFDILDAATERYLSSDALKTIESTREGITTGSVAYYLYESELGYLGKVVIRKTGENKSELEITDSPMPDDQDVITYYYHESGWRVDDGSYWITIGDELRTVHGSELVPLAKELQEKRRNYLSESVIPEYFKFLSNEDFWSQEERGIFSGSKNQGLIKNQPNTPSPRVPTKPKKLNDWKVAWRKVKGRWKGGANYQELARLANVSPETIADIVKAGDAGLLD